MVRGLDATINGLAAETDAQVPLPKSCALASAAAPAEAPRRIRCTSRRLCRPARYQPYRLAAVSSRAAELAESALGAMVGN